MDNGWPTLDCSKNNLLRLILPLLTKIEECKRSNDNNARLNHAKATIHAR